MRFLLATLIALSFPAHAVLVCETPHCDDCAAEIPYGFTWYVGQADPGEIIMDPHTFYCVASGPELAWIRAKFSGIPMRSGMSRAVVWVGDDARFIALNVV